MSWYVRRESGVAGPFTESEVFKRIADGNIGRLTMVREDPAAEWCPIESSIFVEAFGASNPYNNPELIAPKKAHARNPFIWLAAGTVCVLAIALMRALSQESDPARSGQLFGEFVGRALGSLVLWGLVWALVRFVGGLIRPKDPNRP